MASFGSISLATIINGGSTAVATSTSTPSGGGTSDGRPQTEPTAGAGGASGSNSGVNGFQPLTTIFTPPANCFTEIQDYVDVLQVPAQWNSQCWPGDNAYGQDITWSPGVCPSGFAPQIGTINILPSMNETIISCCPPSFSYTSSSSWGAGACQSGINQVYTTSTGVIPFIVGGQSTYSTVVEEIAFTTITSGTMTSAYQAIESVTVVITNASYVLAYPFEVRFRRSDTAVLSLWSGILSETSSGSASTAPSSSSGSSSAAGGSPSSSNNTSGSRLSGGPIAGIVIGALAGFILLTVAILLWLRRRTRRTRQNSSAPIPEAEWHKPELDGNVMAAKEFPVHDHNELHGQHEPAELPVTTYELGGR